jgi:excisionase family DNA binding protein
MSEQLLLSQTELARLLDLSIRTISRMNASGKIPKPVRVGRSVRWRRKEIEEWIAAGCPKRLGSEARCS